jgi:predicted metalloprotease with PDZ domain
MTPTPLRLLVALLLAAAARPAAAEHVVYQLEPDPVGGLMHVSLEWQTAGQRTTSLLHLSPTAGGIRDLPSLLTNFEFKGAQSAQSLDGVWTVTHAPGALLKIRYTVKAGQRTLDWKKYQLPVTNRRFFHGLGKTFLLAPQGGSGLPPTYDFVLRWKIPPDWKSICTWGGEGPTVAAHLDPIDLRDSVYLAGTLEFARARAGGANLTVAMVDHFKFDAARMRDFAVKIIDYQVRFFAEQKFPDFVVTVVPVGDPVKPGEARLSGSGLYHGFALWLAPASELTDAVENLFSHELMHFWIGRMLKAAEPDGLCYWFSEGLTEYYSLRTMHESGFWNAATYAKWVNRHLREYPLNPARNVSNEVISRDYWTKRDTVGEAPYQRGALLGLRWHRLARDRGVKNGLDALLFALLERARNDPKFVYRNSDVRRIGAQSLGPWFEAEFDRYVERAELIDVPADALAPQFDGRIRPIYEFDAGFDFMASQKQKMVVGVRPDGPAAKAGLKSGDRLLAMRLRADAETEVEMTIERDGRRRDVRYFPRGKRQDVLQFSPSK